MIEVRSLSHYYGERCALDDVSFSIRERDVIGFLGLNGAGKTTMLKILSGVMVPTQGDVFVDGIDLSLSPLKIRSLLGFLPDEPPLYSEMSVVEYLRFVGGLKGMSSSDLDKRIPIVLEICKITDHARRIIGELSHGYKKRVGIAQAIVHSPKLVILDEPIGGLDPIQIVEMRRVIMNLKQESTVLVSSHILSEVSQTCDRILVLKRGRLVAQGSEEELNETLRTNTRVRMRLRASPDAVRAALAHLHELGRVEVGPPDGSHVDATAELKGTEREALVATLVGAGIGVYRFEDIKSELEEIFLGLTQENAA